MQINKSRRNAMKALGALALVPLLPQRVDAGVAPLIGSTMGTGYRVQITDRPQDFPLRRLRQQIEEVLERTENSMSAYRPDSELRRFNRHQPGDWFPIGADLERVVNSAVEISDRSGGAFNPVVGSLVDRWGFGPQPTAINPSSHQDINRPTTSTVKNQLLQNPGYLRRTRPGAQLDLNAIAKGDAVDQVGLLLEFHDISNYMVEIGGEIRVRGPGINGDGWRIGIEHPAGGLLASLSLRGGAIATSGDYLDYYISQGKRFCHLIDPATGTPIAHDTSAVSVIADRAIEADAWATALMVMRPDRGFGFAIDNNIPALFVRRTVSGYQTWATAEFKRRQATG